MTSNVAYSKNEMLPESTYFSDPNATHYVEGIDYIGNFGAGIMGYYTSEFDAWRIARHLKLNKVEKVRVNPMTALSVSAGINLLVKDFIQ